MGAGTIPSPRNWGESLCPPMGSGRWRRHARTSDWDDPRRRAVRMGRGLRRCAHLIDLGAPACRCQGPDRRRPLLGRRKCARHAGRDDELKHPDGEARSLLDGNRGVLLQLLAVEASAIGRSEVEVVGAGVVETDDAVPSRDEVALEDYVVERVPGNRVKYPTCMRASTPKPHKPSTLRPRPRTRPSAAIAG